MQKLVFWTSLLYFISLGCADAVPPGYKKYVSFNYYRMEGVSEILNSSKISEFVLLKRVNSKLICIRNSDTNFDIIYEYKDSLWRNYLEYEIEEADVHVIERTYCTGDTLVIKQTFHKEQGNKTSTVEINTPTLKVDFEYNSQYELNKKIIRELVSRTVVNYDKKIAELSSSGCYKCRKVFFQDFLLIYKPVEEIERTEFQYISKSERDMKFGVLLLVFKVKRNDEFDIKEYPFNNFVAQYPWKQYQ